MENSLSSFWHRNRMIFKGLLIGFLLLLLMIPTYMIQNLVEERQARQQEAIFEVSSKWAGSQVITGPVVAVPFWQNVTDAKGTISREVSYAYFLPDDLRVDATILPEKRYRGIYEVMVYTANINLSGSFSKFNSAELKIPATDMLWNEASVFFNVDDVRGLKEQVVLNWGGSPIELTPGKVSNDQFKNALSASIALDSSVPSVVRGATFNMQLKLKGSQDLKFVPVGKKTHVDIKSAYPDPSFTGTYLPDNRTITEKGFNASWDILSLNRSFPQQWVGRGFEPDGSAFGVELEVPVDSYQKSMRSVKYAILCIVLTFTAFFLIELIYARALHPFQYVLVGFALCIFYTLLLSISEYLGFNTAYIIAAVATVSLVAWYAQAALRSTRVAFFITLLLAAMYGFIFILIQSQDYALLMGSIGLFVTLAVVMYFSRKVKSFEQGQGMATAQGIS